jgi:EAL and modified HD-GYP domain-containing signal transduction protein
MFMIYAKAVSKNNEVSPLMLMVKNRTGLMELILKKINPQARSNMLGQAYFVGVLSLIDTIFGAKMEKILGDMNVDEVVRDAILYDKGILGEIYALVRDIEQFDTKKVAAFEQKYALAESSLHDLMLESMREVTIFEDALR